MANHLDHKITLCFSEIFPNIRHDNDVFTINIHVPGKTTIAMT